MITFKDDDDDDDHDDDHDHCNTLFLHNKPMARPPSNVRSSVIMGENWMIVDNTGMIWVGL